MLPCSSEKITLLEQDRCWPRRVTMFRADNAFPEFRGKRLAGGRLLKRLGWPKSPKHSVFLFVAPVILISCQFYALAASPAVDDLVVGTTIGKLRGIQRPSGGAEFLGIPY